LLALIASALTTAAQPAAVAEQLGGEWVVDLSVDPAKPYTKAMKLDLASNGTVAGMFYESVIQAGRWKSDRGRTCASFRTRDGAGPYHTTVCLNGATATGQTWAEHRNFLFNRNSTRAR
jgi:hypothetical protein